MADDRKNFLRRLGRITRQHRAMAYGYTASIRGDGLILVHPKRIQFKLPLRGFVLLMAMFMLFKGFMIASLGSQGYVERLDILRTGSLFEQAGAFVMGVDPVSKVVSDLLDPLVG